MSRMRRAESTPLCQMVYPLDIYVRTHVFVHLNTHMKYLLDRHSSDIRVVRVSFAAKSVRRDLGYTLRPFSLTVCPSLRILQHKFIYRTFHVRSIAHHQIIFFLQCLHMQFLEISAPWTVGQQSSSDEEACRTKQEKKSGQSNLEVNYRE